MLVLLLWHTFRVSHFLARLFHWALPFLLYPIYLNFSKIPISEHRTPHLGRKVAPTVAIEFQTKIWLLKILCSFIISIRIDNHLSHACWMHVQQNPRCYCCYDMRACKFIRFSSLETCCWKRTGSAQGQGPSRPGCSAASSISLYHDNIMSIITFSISSLHYQ